jgi:hypothetical protein
MKNIALIIAGGALWVATSILLTEMVVAAERERPRPAQSCRPDREQVAVYSASGRCNTLGEGIYRTTVAAGLRDDPIASIVLGSFAYAVVCGIDDDFKLECEKVGGSSKRMNQRRAPWTYVQVAKSDFDLDCRPKETEVTISSTSLLLRAGPCIRLKLGKYENATKLGFADVALPAVTSRREEAARKLRKAGTLLVKGHGFQYGVLVGNKVQARICKQENFEDCSNLINANPNIFVGVAVEPASIHVQEYCRPKSYQVGVFAEPDGFGACIIRDGKHLTAESLKIGGSLGLSLRLGGEALVITCTGENLQGDCVDFIGPQIVNRPGGIGSLLVHEINRRPNPNRDF